MRRINIEWFSVTSREPLRDVLATLHAAVGHPDMDAFRKSVSATKTLSELEKVIRAAVGQSGFMEFMRFDHSEVVHKGETGERPGIVRLVIGNPLIMRHDGTASARRGILRSGDDSRRRASGRRSPFLRSDGALS
jgi:hypothetical protein